MGDSLSAGAEALLRMMYMRLLVASPDSATRSTMPATLHSSACSDLVSLPPCASITRDSIEW